MSAQWKFQLVPQMFRVPVEISNESSTDTLLAALVAAEEGRPYPEHEAARLKILTELGSRLSPVARNGIKPASH